ncbi:MAG: phenylalanine--tRNA ligase subunit beta [Thermoguttaceae bacterium]|nr:phenylalanine--tRNA ligase subunit beta [Thermoguttaceae bacterium]MDW8036889.1 phenylalanine--tRNA ligase subunit beta [Thermoguttaceae bacterium]
MIISWNWLKQYVLLDMPVEELCYRLMMAGFNHEGTTEVGGDLAIDLEITSNRPDCLSHLGIAREVGALYGRPVRIPAAQPTEGNIPVERLVQVRIECPDLCFRYVARVIRGVRIGPSPAWLARRLRTVGITPINNVVDVSNYVLMECGQPLHTFDFAKIQGRTIVVRRPKPGETIEAINHQRYWLGPDMCLICDAQRPVAIAGVMGGAETEISDSTTDVLVEAAEFDPVSIRRTARALGLHSESSFRFERGVDPEGVDWASRRCCELILQLAGGELAAGAVDVGRKPPQRQPIALRFAQIRRILGIDVPREKVREILLALGLQECPPTDSDLAGCSSVSQQPIKLNSLPMDPSSAICTSTSAGEPPSSIPSSGSPPSSASVRSSITDQLSTFDHLSTYTQPSAFTQSPSSTPSSAFVHQISGQFTAQTRSATENASGSSPTAQIQPDRVLLLPPSWRSDLQREIDLIEEVARIYGYEKIPEDVRVPMTPSVRTKQERVLEKVRHVLTGCGLDEAITFSVVEPGWIRAFLPWTSAEPLRTQTPLVRGANVLRQSLVPSLLAARRTNESVGNSRIELFEIARVFWPQPGALPIEEQMLAITSGRPYLELKGILEALLEALKISEPLRAEPAQCPQLAPDNSCRLYLANELWGFVGQISAELQAQTDLRHPCTVAEVRIALLVTAAELVPQYRPVAPYPAITRDVNLVVDEPVRWADVAATVWQAGGPWLESVQYRHTYRDPQRLGEGKKSLLMTLAFRCPDRTLTNPEADQLRDLIVAACQKHHGAQLRAG